MIQSRNLAIGALLVLLLSGCRNSSSRVASLQPPHITGAEAGDPVIACDPASDDVLLAWIAGESTSYRVWFARSADRGEHWSVPVAVSPPGEPLRIHPESSPRMVCDGAGRVAMAWSTSVDIAGRRFPASDLRCARSLDGGAHWSEALTVNDDTASGPGSHTFHDLALLPQGGLVAAWLDSRPGGDGNGPGPGEGHDASIHMAQSRDFGGHWSANAAKWSRVCPCCRVSLATDSLGTVYASYRKHFPDGIRDIVTTRADEPPMRAHTDGWQIEGCPHSGPPIAASPDGCVRLAWFTGSDGRAGVWFRQSRRMEFDSSAVALPVLVSEQLPTVHVGLADAGTHGTLIACDSDSTGHKQLTLARVEASGRAIAERFVVPGTRGVSHPKLTTANAGATAYLVWTTHKGDRSELQLARWDVGR